MEFTNEFQIIQEAKAQFPEQYEEINEDFLVKYQEPITKLKEVFESKGGIHLVKAGKHSMICRLPAREHVKQATKNNSDGFDQDRELLGYCLLYPKIQVVDSWIKSGSIAVITNAVKTLYEIAGVYEQGEAKKL